MTEPTRQRLFTPGPLNTSDAVRHAMQRDMGSRDADFIEIVRNIRRDLLAIPCTGSEFTAVPVQGSGTFAIESAIGSLLPGNGKLLVLANGPVIDIENGVGYEVYVGGDQMPAIRKLPK